MGKASTTRVSQAENSQYNGTSADLLVLNLNPNEGCAKKT
jgi:hypothetical protein